MSLVSNNELLRGSVSPTILSKNPKCRFSKGKGRTIVKGNAVRRWVGFKNPCVGGRRKSFSGRRREDKRAQKKSFGIGCRTHFTRAVLARRTQQSRVPQETPARTFSVWRLWPPTHLLPWLMLVKPPAIFGGKGDLMAKEDHSFDPVLCSCGKAGQLPGYILGRCLCPHCFVVPVGISCEDGLEGLTRRSRTGRRKARDGGRYSSSHVAFTLSWSYRHTST